MILDFYLKFTAIPTSLRIYYAAYGNHCEGITGGKQQNRDIQLENDANILKQKSMT